MFQCEFEKGFRRMKSAHGFDSDFLPFVSTSGSILTSVVLRLARFCRMLLGPPFFFTLTPLIGPSPLSNDDSLSIGVLPRVIPKMPSIYIEGFALFLFSHNLYGS